MFVFEESEVITGERIQASCNVAVTTPRKLAVHPSIPAMPLAVLGDDLSVNAEAIRAVGAARTVFVYADFIKVFFERLLPTIDHPVVVVSSGGDQQIGKDYQRYLSAPNLLHWFSTNAALDSPKLTAIPIGLANSHWPHGNTAAIAEVAARGTKKDDKLYVNFEIGTNPKDRAPVLAAMARANFVCMGRATSEVRSPIGWARKILGMPPIIAQGPAMPYHDYLVELAQHRFCLSPPGNGIDCHRTWESLYVGAIPVMSRSPVRLFEGLPHLLFSDLTSLTAAQISAAAANLRGPFEFERLTVQYWIERIRDRTRLA